MLPAELKASLVEFVSFTSTLKGDEKGEAQLFLDHLFRALGHDGVKEAGATLEYRIAKKPGSMQLELLRDDGGNKGRAGKRFADLLWPERVLIEMKSRGQNLEKHYDQLFDYWTHIVPFRPPYAILCNFDEFWIYNFNTQLFDPLDRVRITELPHRSASLNFLLPSAQRPLFGNNRVEVTRKAANTFASVFRGIIARGESRDRAQRFLLQLLASVVSEDIGLLPDGMVTALLADCVERPHESYDLLGGLFQQMARPEPARGGRFSGVDYFNGGLFSVVEPINLGVAEAAALHDAAASHNWAKVKPEIFGTLFQHSMGAEDRHALGAHFTNEFDIQKVIGPTIVKPWRQRIDAAGRNVSQLRDALAQLRAFRVLDPACGSGNFLFVAYREIKRLEREILQRLSQFSKRERLESAISLKNFYGIDKDEFAVELAKVTLMLAKELEVLEAKKTEQSDQLLIEERALPLDNLDQNIRCADALFSEWPSADVIVGNPPYQSKNKMQKELGAAYTRKLRDAYPAIPGRADFCVYWFRRAHDHLADGARAGLVGTNTIRENYSRIGGLEYIINNGGIITDAVSSEVWSGDAAVHVSIVNWVKNAAADELPKIRRLTLQKGNSIDSPWESYELPWINAALSPTLDVTTAARLKTNAASGGCFQGQTHGHEDFVINHELRTQLIKADPATSEVLFPYLTFDEMISNLGSQPDRWIIDLQPRDIFEAGGFRAVIEHLRKRVLPDRETAALEEERRNKQVSSGGKAKVNKHHANFLKRWWLLSYGRGALIKKLSTIHRYIVCGQVSKRNIVEFVSTQIRPNAQLIVFPFIDDYSFGVLQSEMHWRWFVARGSTHEERPRYTSDTVFDSFPWPQQPSRQDVLAVASAAVELRKVRNELLSKHRISLRDLYRSLDEPGENLLRSAHQRLDCAVRKAYRADDNAEPLSFLLQLNLALGEAEKNGRSITGPGFPLSGAELRACTTQDCISVNPQDLKP